MINCNIPIIFLIIVIFLINSIKSNSIELIINPNSNYSFETSGGNSNNKNKNNNNNNNNNNNKNNKYRKCGLNLENACLKISDGINYFQTLSNNYSELILKLVDGEYSIGDNNFEMYGYHLSISPYNSNSNNVIFIGDNNDHHTNFIKINSSIYKTINTTKLTITNINFKNIYTSIILSETKNNNDSTIIQFNNCNFTNCDGRFSFYLSSKSTSSNTNKNINYIINNNNQTNSLTILNSNFQNINTKSILFNNKNFNIEIKNTKFSTLGLFSFFNPINGDASKNKVEISKCLFKKIKLDTSFFNSNSGQLIIVDSELNDIVTPFNFISIDDNNEFPVIINNNSFSNINGKLINVFNSSLVYFNSNIFSNHGTTNQDLESSSFSSSSSIGYIWVSSNSKVYMNSNTFNNFIVEEDFIFCFDSNIYILNNVGSNIINSPSCILCNIDYNNIKICSF
ncbi:hypothetical protein ACTFIV_005273 [Dictyostelium citrinum]